MNSHVKTRYIDNPIATRQRADLCPDRNQAGHVREYGQIRLPAGGRKETALP